MTGTGTGARQRRRRPSMTITGLRAGLGRPAAALAKGPPDGVPGSQARRASIWRGFFSGIWLLYLIQPAAALFSGHHGTGYAVAGSLLFAAFCVVYIIVVAQWDQSPRQTRITLAALFALAAAITLAFHGNGSWIFVSAASGLAIR